eukprot:9487723-Pyramimonas_sp.AAC.1
MRVVGSRRRRLLRRTRRDCDGTVAPVEACWPEPSLRLGGALGRDRAGSPVGGRYIAGWHNDGTSPSRMGLFGR